MRHALTNGFFAVTVAVAGWGVAGCKQDPGRLEWRADFATEGLRARAAVVTLTIHKGRCAEGPSDASAALYTARVAAGQSARAPGDLGAGDFVFAAVAEDDACYSFAAGCTDLTLPSPDRRGRVEVVLNAEEDFDLCPTGVCEAARCADGGVDADARPDGGGCACEVDLNGDGDLDALDFNITDLCTSRGIDAECLDCTSGTCSSADIDCDGDIDHCEVDRLNWAWRHASTYQPGDACGAAVTCGRCDLLDGGCIETTTETCTVRFAGTWAAGENCP